MNRINAKRLLHTLLPFMVMNMIQRAVLLLCQPYAVTALAGDALSLAAFVLAASAAALMFSRKTYTDDSETDAAPLTKLPVGMCVMHAVVSCAAMTVLMYAVSLMAGGSVDDGTEFTVVGIISAVIIHPVSEELLFRKMFYGELRLMNPIFGCFAQALMFAILHSTVDGMIYALAGGIVLAVLYEHTGRIGASIAAHAFVNLRSILCLTVLADFPGAIQWLDFALIAAGFVCFIARTALPVRKTEEKADE